MSRISPYYVKHAFDNILILGYVNNDMPRDKSSENTRQIYASIREDLYLSVKARATELRMPMRAFIEIALEQALSGTGRSPDAGPAPSLWNDEYLRMQAQQPLGSPVELTREEAERVVREGFTPP